MFYWCVYLHPKLVSIGGSLGEGIWDNIEINPHISFNNFLPISNPCSEESSSLRGEGGGSLCWRTTWSHIELVQHTKASRHRDRFWKRNACLQLSGIGGGRTWLWGKSKPRMRHMEWGAGALPFPTVTIPCPSPPRWQHDTARPAWVDLGFPLRGRTKAIWAGLCGSVRVCLFIYIC